MAKPIKDYTELEIATMGTKAFTSMVDRIMSSPTMARDMLTFLCGRSPSAFAEALLLASGAEPHCAGCDYGVCGEHQ